MVSPFQIWLPTPHDKRSTADIEYMKSQPSKTKVCDISLPILVLLCFQISDYFYFKLFSDVQ